VTGLISFRRLLVRLYLATVLPLLLLVGALVYVEYRSFLITEHSVAMQDLVRAIVERGGPPGPPRPNNPRNLAAVLAEQLGPTDFAAIVRDADGQQLAPHHGSGPWLGAELHALVRETRTPLLIRQGNREIALRAVLGPDDRVIATVESSFPHTVIAPDLALLSRWLVLTISGAMLAAVLIAPLVAQLAVRPLRGLLQTVRRVGTGQLAERAALPRVAEVRELAQSFNGMLDQIEAAFAAQARSTAEMQRFAADASHELRSPLAVLRSGVEILGMALHHDDWEQIRRTLPLLEQELAGMSRLVDDLLLLARMEQPVDDSAGSPLRFEWVELLPLVEEVVERARVLAQGQSVQFCWPRSPLPPLWADGEALRRVLNNLLENALRHTPSGRAITVGVESTAQGCRIVLGDQGSGIAASHLPHVFERFYRADSARGRGGSGLGLAIAQAIIAAHGGTIELSSSEGVGTTVTLHLPAQPQPLHHDRTS
jgi:two-component system OmpR family sensor kinase